MPTLQSNDPRIARVVSESLAANHYHPVAIIDYPEPGEVGERLKVFEIAATLRSLLSQGRHCPPEAIENARAELIWRSNALIFIPGNVRWREQW